MSDKHTIRTQTNKVRRLSKKQYTSLRELTRLTGSLYNKALKHEQAHYQVTGKYLQLGSLDKKMQHTPEYQYLPSVIAQQVLRDLDKAYRSFFARIKNENKEAKHGKVKPPQPREDEHMTMRIPAQKASARNGVFTLARSRRMRCENAPIIKQVIPERVNLDEVKEIRIVPCQHTRYFKIQYVYERPVQDQMPMSNNVLGIDLGVDNFAACLPSTGERGFIIDGRHMKSVNQFTDKVIASLKSRLSEDSSTPVTSRRIDNVLKHHENVSRDFTFKAARYVIEYCLGHRISMIVIGVNKGFKRRSRLGRVTNGHFQRMPFFRFRRQLACLCEENGVGYVEQEESYTSKASCLDGDPIPVFGAPGADVSFSGVRSYRGLYVTRSGVRVNADMNGAGNIVRKFLCNGDALCVDCDVIRSGLCRGLRVGPVRVRVS